MAYKWRQHLVRQAKDLNAMRKDLDSADFRRGVDWNATVVAKHTFAEPCPIERWALAEHFLTGWIEWRGILDRWGRYFGQLQDAWSGAFWTTYNKLGWRAHELLRDTELYLRLRKALLDAAGMEPVPESQALDLPQAAVAHAIINDVIAHDLRLRLAKLMDQQRDTVDEELSHNLKRVDQQNISRLKALDSGASEAAIELLRTYRHSTLRMSWLSHNGPTSWAGSEILSAPSEDKEELPAGLLQIVGGAGDEAKRLVLRAITALDEIGFDAFAEDVTSDDMRGGDDSPLAAKDVAVLGTGTGIQSAKIVVVVPRGDARRGAQGLYASISALASVISREPQLFELILFITNSWDASVLAGDPGHALQLIWQSGKRTAVVMAPPPFRPEHFAIGFASSVWPRILHPTETTRPAEAQGKLRRKIIHLRSEDEE
jgi:hypothetical protein